MMPKLFVASLLAASGPCAVSALQRSQHQWPGDEFDTLNTSIPGDVDIFCRIYSDKGDAGGKWVFSEDPEAVGSSDLDDGIKLNMSAAFDAVINARETMTLSKKLKSACVGADWNGKRCQAIAVDIRKFYWSKVKQHLPGNPGKAPPVRTFRIGGGVTADVHCKPGNPAHMYFRHIYKAAGFAIKKNLALLSNKHPRDFIDDNWRTQDCCSKYSYAKQNAMPKPVLFTYVREPMEKFISGYKEIAVRGEFKRVPPHGPKIGSKEHAKLFLNNVWHGSCDNGHVLLQVQSMMGPACESHFDFIGKLEHFKEDWQKVGKHAGCTSKLGWPEEWTHPSQENGKGADQAMRAVLHENGGALAKALCLWLLPDYIAFDYPLPPVCGR